MDEILLTDNGKIVLKYLQDHDQNFVGKDLIDLTGVKGVYRVLYSLTLKGLVKQTEPISRNFVTSRGETVLKSYQTYELTDMGRNYSVGK